MALTKKKPSGTALTLQQKRPSPESRDCLLTDEVALRWAIKPSWSLQEAIYLGCNRNPGCTAAVTQSRNHKTIKVGKTSAATKKTLSDTVRRANKGGDLPEHVTPVGFVEWAQTVGVELPDVLIAAVTTTHSQVKNWKAEFDRTQRELTWQIEQNALLKSENEHVKHTLKDDELGTKEKASVYKILAGLAYKYGYMPGKRSNATSIMHSAVIQAGLKIDEDTVRNKIVEACTMYLSEIKKNSNPDQK